MGMLSTDTRQVVLVTPSQLPSLLVMRVIPLMGVKQLYLIQPGPGGGMEAQSQFVKVCFFIVLLFCYMFNVFECPSL